MTIKHLETEAAFDDALKAAKDKIVIVDFYADWCGPCKRLAPALEKMAEQHTNVHFYKVNVEENVAISKRYKISAMPTILFFKSHEQVDKVIGADISKITDKLEALLK